MVEARELITICRQIGTMMEVGVDFLRITRALREQTDNPRLLELYNQIEHDMRMGGNLADAIDKAPDVFSPFAVSLIRQGEARGDIEGAWHRLADFYKQEAQENKDLGLDAAGKAVPERSEKPQITGRASLEANPELLGFFQTFLCWSCGWLLLLALLWCGVAAGVVASRWIVALELGVSAAFVGAAAWNLTRKLRLVQLSGLSKSTESENAPKSASSSPDGASWAPTDNAPVKGDEEMPF